MTPEEVARIEEATKAMEAVRTCLREMCRPRADFSKLNGELRKAIELSRKTVAEASFIVFEQRKDLVVATDSASMADLLFHFPKSRLTVEISWLSPYFTAEEVVKLRNNATKLHGRRRRDQLDQNPIPDGTALEGYVNWCLRTQVEPILSMTKVSKTKRAIRHAEDWVNGALVLMRNAETDVGGIFEISYAIASAQIGRRG